MHFASARRVLLVVVLAIAVCGVTWAQESGEMAMEMDEPAPAALPMGMVAEGTVSAGSSAVYAFEAETAGLLSVQVHTDGGADLYLGVTDAVGQPLPDGMADIDAGGSLGTEAVNSLLRRPGSYRVMVETHGQGADFKIAASFLPTPSLELAPDPDGLPTGAQVLTVGSPVTDSLDPESGDDADWYAIEVADGGMVTVVVEAADGDLALELYRHEEYEMADQRSDQDLEGMTGHESLAFRVDAGERVHLKVLPVFGGGHIEYTIRMGVM